ncbi:MAG: zinc-binding dehydrogenase, partial [Acidimicrobiales bacterium]
AQLLAQLGATVIGVTRSEWKRDLAVQLGARQAVSPDDAVAAVAEMTDGRGADIVIEAVGTEATLAQSIELAGHAGTVVLYGTAADGGQGLPYYQLYFKELTIRCPRAATRADYQRSIDLVAGGRIKAAPLVTSRFDLGQADQALAAVKEPSALKVLMTVPQGAG